MTNEKKLGAVVLFEKQWENLLEKILGSAWKNIEGYVKSKYLTGEIVLGSPESLALEKWEHTVKWYLIGAFEEGKKLGLSLPDMVWKINSKYHMDLWKKKAMNEIQQANLYEYKQLKEWADEDWHKLELWDLLVSTFPTPDKIVNEIYEREFIKQHWIDLEEYEIYNNLDYSEVTNPIEYKKRIHTRMTKEKAYAIKQELKKNFKELWY